MHRFIPGAIAILVLALPASPAQAATGPAKARACAAPGEIGGKRELVASTARATGPALVTARTRGGNGDWNLAVADAGGRVIAASAYPGSAEVAQGFATEAGELRAVACRAGGKGAAPRVTLEVTALTEPAPRMQIVRVSVPDEAASDALTASGLDLTEHGGEGFIDVVLHAPTEAGVLDDLGLDYRIVQADLLETALADRRAELRANRGGGGGLPSGRTGPYRTPDEFTREMRELAKRNPKLVRYFTLAQKTYEGRPIEAIEVAPGVRRKDGRPVFLLMGAHHAREWPSAEHTLEFAYELVKAWKQKRPAIAKLMRRARVVFVPIVNPDGFNTSRMAATALLSPDGRGGIEEPNLLLPYEYQRKNCRTFPTQPEPGGSCSQLILPTGLAQFGVDPNRNYGGFWGGPGASADDSLPYGALAQNYRGPGPFSEPESRSIRRLVSRRQVTTLITNHTFSNLVLRPPGLQSQGRPPDERIYKRLGDAMARENGYTSQRSYQLYDTTGTTEDWSYYATGGLGFTFEIGPSNFHPPYQDGVVAEYRGTTDSAGAGGGNRAAYLAALRSTANAKHHSVIAGRAPGRSVLTLTKTFRTPTSPVMDGLGVEGDVIRFRDRLKTTLRVGRSGRFAWHVNPSTRPLVVERRRERWTLECRPAANRPVADRRKVFVKRGERMRLNLRRACSG